MTDKNEQSFYGVASVLNAETIHKLRAEVKRLHEVIKQEAEYHHKAALDLAKATFMRRAIQEEHRAKQLLDAIGSEKCKINLPSSNI